MANSERWETGYETIQKVYAGEVAIPPEGNVAFLDLMLKQVFAEVWTREELSMRDRRLLVMGVIACICPWNYPLFCSAQKWAAALVFGNTSVVKASPFTPLTLLRLGEW